uniref:Uncharacterized protein n=1 Tax=Candidatus Kentrum sp. MB TaxID=2138164 RepID=A0A450XV69_9GAMM|nr:MAG: hypothetical protein BECKMB1821G_GA0114241_105711 [Candidatus Kentron sp. MB]VFK33168.1 MAG: hypothetical protein BECKMB1821I_GA0114274_104111 [Candidatus Kentron sp. MB]
MAILGRPQFGRALKTLKIDANYAQCHKPRLEWNAPNSSESFGKRNAIEKYRQYEGLYHSINLMVACVLRHGFEGS